MSAIIEQRVVQKSMGSPGDRAAVYGWLDDLFDLCIGGAGEDGVDDSRFSHGQSAACVYLKFRGAP